MTCKKCNYEFCWNCNAPFRNAQGHPIHPSYCELPGGQGMADQNDYEEPIFDQRVQRALDLRNDARENNHLIEDRIRDEVRNNMERNEHQFKGSLCCITGCILMCSLMLNNHSRVADPHLFIKNYQPRFEGISSGQAMAERYCPNFLGAAPEDQKMMDPILACNELTTLEHGLNQHRVSMLNRLSDMFPSPPNGYYDAVTQSANEHQYNLAQIALAKEKCGCIKESKKTK
ncbi:MAG: hypothetical protein P4L31_02425 [Candidatus Babeliales bacterium]|nr:hypothetical protein [Candidatus Babeliales bacterium]